MTAIETQQVKYKENKKGIVQYAQAERIECCTRIRRLNAIDTLPIRKRKLDFSTSPKKVLLRERITEIIHS